MIIEGFLPNMGVVSSWSCDKDYLDKHNFPRPMESPKTDFLAKWLSKRILILYCKGTFHGALSIFKRADFSHTLIHMMILFLK